MVTVLPVPELRSELASGQNRLGDIEEKFSRRYDREQFERSLLYLVREGELKVVPNGDHVNLSHVPNTS